MADEVARFNLPVPPSTNNLFRSGPRYKTEVYKQWINEAGWMLQAQRVPPVSKGRYRVTIAAPFSGRRDLDNIKAALDLAVTHGVIKNDNMIDELMIRRVPVTEPFTVTIWRL